jgi:hypothetical protein
MNTPTWQSHPIRVATRSEVSVDVKASADAVVIAQGNGVWFHDLHLADEEHVVGLIGALEEGLVQMRSMRSAP